MTPPIPYKYKYHLHPNLPTHHMCQLINKSQMDSSASTLILPPLNITPTSTQTNLLFDSSIFDKQSNTLPTQFLWPQEDLAYVAQEKFKDPPINLKGFFNGDQEAINLAARQIRTACLKHGFFQVINHGVDQALIHEMHQQMDAFFKLPFSKKLSVRRRPGELGGYSGAHAERYASKLPWKETFSFTYKHANGPGLDVVNYINSGLGPGFEDAG